MAMAMVTLAPSSSLSSLCSISGRPSAVSSQVPAAFSLKRSGRVRGVGVRAQRAGGDPESNEMLDVFYLGKALVETVSDRMGNLVGELLSEVGQRHAEQQQQIREFQNEVQERARVSAARAAQKASTSDPPVSRAAATQVSVVTYDDEPTVTGSTTSAAEGVNGLPSLPYRDLPPLDAPRPPRSKGLQTSDEGKA